MFWLRRHSTPLVGAAIAAFFAVEILLAGGQPWLGVPGALTAGLGLALRRRYPVVGLAVVIAGTSSVILFDYPAVDGGGIGLLAALVLAHYAVGRWTVGPYAWLGAGLVLVSMLVINLVDPEPGVGTADIAYISSLSLLPWGVGLAMRLRSEYIDALHTKNLRLEREQVDAARRAVAAERARIARELHDVVSHAISVTVLQARGARRVLGPGHDDVRGALDAIEQLNSAALGDMRRLLAVLRDTDDSAGRNPQPSLSNLDALVAQVRSAGLPVEVTISGAPGAVPPGVDLSAYRIVQEALTNVLKHAATATATATITLTHLPEELQVTVRNTGPGATTDQVAGGRGLVGIRERVAVVGGSMTSGPIEDGGFQIAARLPYSVEVS
jgi:signal transduction histidine kinase